MRFCIEIAKWARLCRVILKRLSQIQWHFLYYMLTKAKVNFIACRTLKCTPTKKSTRKMELIVQYEHELQDNCTIMLTFHICRKKMAKIANFVFWNSTHFARWRELHAAHVRANFLPAWSTDKMDRLTSPRLRQVLQPAPVGACRPPSLV